MKLSDIGEFGLIERFAPLFKHLIPEGLEGIGDDCAIIPINAEESLVITTDLLVEDVHFLKEHILPRELGWKSLAVSLSDIASMGATPVGSFLSIALPENIPVAWTDEFFNGYHDLSSKESTPLLGGDTTKSPDKIVVNVTVVGKILNKYIKRRSGAKPGDLIAVTGCLGDSAAGLKLILLDMAKEGVSSALARSHHMPVPHIKEGKWLSSLAEVHAMMDVSDGISSDLDHIMKASNCHAEVWLEKLPVSDHLTKVSLENGWDIYALATGGGEDYVLLLTIDKNMEQEIKNEFFKMFGKELYIIGEVKEGLPCVDWMLNDEKVDLCKGFNHFG
ncbi:MAG: thiamine-phosphate kinase [Bacteroidota bacterium]|nr:thiamine-phosphate kinase [Bacteroidota bacterium]